MRDETDADRGMFFEVRELIEAAVFSLETAQMALEPSGFGEADGRTLERRLRARGEERETGRVALESLDMARSAFVELARALDRDELVGLGYDLRFWQTFEWCWHRLFNELAPRTGVLVLRHELSEALRRTEALGDQLVERMAPPARH